MKPLCKDEMKPVSEMTNAEIYVEMHAVSDEMRRLDELDLLDERNALVPRYRELYHAYDFGFCVGEIVETYAWGSRWQQATVLEHESDTNYFLLKNDREWKIIVSGNLMRKIAQVVEQAMSEQLTFKLI